MQRIAWASARALLVLALSVVVLDVMASLIGPAVDGTPAAEPRWADGASVWAKARPLTYGDNARRELTVSFDGDRVRATYDLWLPASHPIYRHAEAGADPSRLVVDLFGEVRVAEFPEGLSKRVTTPLVFDPPRATRDPQGVGHLRLEARPYWVRLPDFEVQVAPSRVEFAGAADLMMVHGLGERRMHVHAPSQRVRYGGTLATVDRGGLSPEHLVVSWRGVRDATFLTVLQRFGAAGVSAVGGALWRLGSALPLLLVLGWLWRGRREYGPAFAQLFEFVAVAAGLTLGSAIVSLLLGTEIAIGPYAESWLRSWTGVKRPDDAGEAEVVTLVGALVVLPLAVARLDRRRFRLGAKMAGAAIGALAAVAGTGLVLILLLWRDGQEWPVVGVAAGWLLGALLLWVLASDLAELFGAWRPWPVSAVVTAAALGGLFAQRLLDPLDDRATNVSRVLAFGFAMLAIVAVYAWFAGRVVSALASLAGSAHGRWYGPLASGVVLLCLVPRGVSLLTASPLADVGVHSVIDLVDFLGLLNGLLVFGCLLTGLHVAASGGWVSLDRVALFGALAFAGLVLYWDERWAYLPVTALLGLAATAIVVRRPRQNWPAVAAPAVQELPEPVARRLIERAALIELERAALERRRVAMTSALDVVESADLERLHKSRRAIDAQLSALPPAEPSDESARLADRWRHGTYAALAGTLIGLPWTVLFLADVRLNTIDEQPYGLGRFLVWLFWVTTQWTVYGFFFGYFYPWLRGRNGLAKALSLAVVVVVPPLFFQFVWNDGPAWTRYGIFALKVFLFASALSLVAGDRLLLGAVGLGWRQLIDLYNARYVVVWGSAIALAVGGVVTAGLTVGLQALASMLVDQLGPPAPPRP